MKKILFLTFIAVFNHSVFASIQSAGWKINSLYTYTTPNSDYKVSYSYRLLGNLIPMGSQISSGLRIGLYPELLGLSRGPEPTVENAYVYPNPCNLRYGCNGVSFTKLTLICEINIYNIAGEHIRTIYKNSNVESQNWDLKDKNNKTVSSGLYIFYIKDDVGKIKKGKIIIIR